MTSINNSSSLTDTYDALGRLADRGIPGDKREYIWQPWGDMLSPYSFYTGWYQTPFVLGGRTLGYDTTGTNATTTFLHPDAVGTTAMETDASGAVISGTDAVLYPWGQWLTGNSTAQSDSYFGSIPYTAGDLDQYWATNRNYNPTLGRWMTPDPAGIGAADLSNSQSLNRYAYVGNNPTTLIDPSGLKFCAGSMFPCRAANFGNELNFPNFAGSQIWSLEGGVWSAQYWYQNGEYEEDDQWAGFLGEQGWEVDESGAPLYIQAPPAHCGHQTNQNRLDFVATNLLAAQTIALQLDTNPSNILGMSSLESSDGTSNIAQNYNNFFGLTKGRAFGGTVGTYTTAVGRQFGEYPDPGFLSSGSSFANSFQGARVSGKWDAASFAAALTTPPLAFNSEPGRAGRYVSRINSVDQFIPCVK